MKLPSDLKILTEIYERYYEQFKDFSREDRTRECKVYVPINIRAMAADFKTDEYLLFGRLYNHMNKKYEGNKDSPLFALKDHSVHFPLLASVLAGLKEERNRQNISMYLSIAAFVISVVMVGFNVFKIFYDIEKETYKNTQGYVPPNKHQVQHSK